MSWVLCECPRLFFGEIGASLSKKGRDLALRGSLGTDKLVTPSEVESTVRSLPPARIDFAASNSPRMCGLECFWSSEATSLAERSLIDSRFFPRGRTNQ